MIVFTLDGSLSSVDHSEGCNGILEQYVIWRTLSAAVHTALRAFQHWELDCPNDTAVVLLVSLPIQTAIVFWRLKYFM